MEARPRAGELRLVDRAVDFRDPEIAAALAEAFPGRKNPLPLARQELSFVVEDVDPAVASAFRRTMCTEMPGPFLFFANEDVVVGERDEKFMLSSFLVMQISNLPLRHGLQAAEHEGVSLRLRVANDRGVVRKVYAGDLEFFKDGKPHTPAAPWFNPTAQIAFVNPGNTLAIDNIRVAESTGRMYAAAQTAVRGRCIPLDLEELPLEATHSGYQGDAQRSGFVMRRDGLPVTPRKFRVSVAVPAALRGSDAARKLPFRACDALLMRLRSARTVVDRAQAAAGGDTESSYWAARARPADPGAPQFSEGTLYLRGETETVTQMLKTVLARYPDVSFVGAGRQVEAAAIQLTVVAAGDAEDLSALVAAAIDECLKTIADIREALKKNAA